MNDDEQARLRARAFEGLCPWCPTGPWRNLPIHAAKKHGVGQRALKDYLGVPWSASLVDPDLAERLAENARGHGLADAMHRAPHGDAHDVSAAGRAGRGTSAAKTGPSRRKVTDEQLRKVEELIDRGVKAQDIARRLGISPSGLSQARKRLRMERQMSAESVPPPRPRVPRDRAEVVRDPPLPFGVPDTRPWLWGQHWNPTSSTRKAGMVPRSTARCGALATISHVES